jgi:hypothetical protein
MESEVLMYKATNDPLYLNRVIDVIDKVLYLRDNIQKRKNEFGESGPVWSSGSRYGWGRSLLKNNKNEDVVEVLTYGTWDATTGKNGELRKGNDETYISLMVDVVQKEISVKIENKKLEFNRVYAGLELETEGVIIDDGSVRITILKHSQGSMPITISRELIGNILTTEIINTGLILNPIIELVELIKTRELNEYYQVKADLYLEAAIEAIDYHENDWVNVDSNMG